MKNSPPPPPPPPPQARRAALFGANSIILWANATMPISPLACNRRRHANSSGQRRHANQTPHELWAQCARSEREAGCHEVPAQCMGKPQKLMPILGVSFFGVVLFLVVPLKLPTKRGTLKQYIPISGHSICPLSATEVLFADSKILIAGNTFRKSKESAEKAHPHTHTLFIFDCLNNIFPTSQQIVDRFLQGISLTKTGVCFDLFFILDVQ